VNHYEPFTITFPTDDQARAVLTPRTGDPDSVLSALKLKAGPVMFIMGGAGLMDDDSLSATRGVVENGLARFAQEHQITVIDGGTASGVMALMGMARKRAGHTFPLVGVAPHAVVTYPGHVSSENTSVLDSFHTHFVLTDGDDFGAESDMIAMLATAISLDRRYPAMGLVINGGQIVRREVRARTVSGNMHFPILVLEGSGRFADDLAQARDGHYPEGETDDIREILASGVAFASIEAGSDAMRVTLAQYFAS
jgi:hypothetical protein